MTLLVPIFLPRDFGKREPKTSAYILFLCPACIITTTTKAPILPFPPPPPSRLSCPPSLHLHTPSLHTPVIAYLNFSPGGFHTRGRFFSCPHDTIFEVTRARLVLLMGIINTVSLLPHIEMESFPTLSSLTVIKLQVFILLSLSYPHKQNDEKHDWRTNTN